MGAEQSDRSSARRIPADAFPGDHAPIRHDVEIEGRVQVAFEWNAAARGAEPTLLLVHATGFHARVWDRVVLALGDRHVVAIDQYGHGRSEGEPVTHWRRFVDTLAAMVDRLGVPEGAVGVGHSMGGHALVGVTASAPAAFGRLVLIDPVIAEPSSYRDDGGSLPGRGPSPVSKRKRIFASREAMWRRFVDRHPYALFREDVVRDYCHYGLLERAAPDGEGAWALACAPEMEASVYTTSRTNAAIFEAVARAALPVAILRASPGPEGGPIDFATSPSWPGLVDAFPNARERHLPELTHFMPMQDPGFVARAILNPDAVLERRLDPAPSPSRAEYPA